MVIRRKVIRRMLIRRRDIHRRDIRPQDIRRRAILLPVLIRRRDILRLTLLSTVNLLLLNSKVAALVACKAGKSLSLDFSIFTCSRRLKSDLNHSDDMVSETEFRTSQLHRLVMRSASVSSP